MKLNTLLVETSYYADGKEIRQMDDLLIHLQREKNVRDAINLEILRDWKIIDVVFTLEKRPDS